MKVRFETQVRRLSICVNLQVDLRIDTINFARVFKNHIEYRFQRAILPIEGRKSERILNEHINLIINRKTTTKKQLQSF